MVAALAAASCATSPTEPAPSKQPASSTPAVSTAPSTPTAQAADAQRYLTNVFQFTCARNYIPYPDGELPPVPVRSEAERAERAEELAACKQAVAEEYTRPKTVRAVTWNGTRHSMSPAAMQWVVQHGEQFLDDYVRGLIAGEIQREGESSRNAATVARTE